MNQDRHIAWRELPRPLRAKARRAWAVLVWERLWPALWPALGVAGLFALSALAGIWRDLPLWSQLSGLILFALALLAALIPAARLRLPSALEALRRLELNSGLPHRPATAYMDRPAAREAAPAGEASANRDHASLWQAHRARAARMSEALRAGLPRSSLMRRDPYALRVLLTLCLVVAFVMSGPQWRELLLSPFQLAAHRGAPVSIDAWISPPAYTGLAPRFLAATQEAEAPPTIEAPAGSELIVRVQGRRAVTMFLSGEAGGPPLPLEASDENEERSVREFRAELTRPLTATVRTGRGTAASWRFAIRPDLPPEIKLTRDPQTTQRGALELEYSVTDDYGAVSAEAGFEALDGQGRPAAGETPLVDPPRIDLRLPSRASRDGTAKAFRDLHAHPWAGSETRLILRARDQAGNIGESTPVDIRLPERNFRDSLARALIEQRRDLALHPSRRLKVARILDALTTEPEDIITDNFVYLSLRTAYWRLRNNAERDELLSVVHLLWDIALHIEDGDLSLAERRLRDLQEQLERALAENAPPEEIERLLRELRQALNEFMRALAEAARNAPQSDQPLDPNGRILRPEDLARMLDNIRDLSRSGARDQARQLLSQLRNLLENLRTARPGQRSPGQQMMSEALRQLQDMIARQQRLMDQTYRFGNGQRQPGRRQPGQRGENGSPQQGLGPMAGEQRALEQQLKDLLEQLRKGGARPNRGMGEAGRSMGEAADSLGRNDAPGALPHQQRALENLRRGAQGLARQLAQGRGPGVGPPSGQRNTDPLGRPLQQGPIDPETTQQLVPKEFDVETVRNILEELRRRLGEQGRPRIEMEYLERLLSPF